MYRISELAEQAGLSRTTLLYYEKQGLISGRRQSNGYRIYSDKDLQRLRLVQNLLAGGLTLKECKACLETRVDRALLQSRLQQLDDEIARKQTSRQLLAALLGEEDLSGWHTTMDKIAPDAHQEWLIKQGFTEKEALRLKWLSKDMNEHEQYMADFMRIFTGLDRWGPGSEQDTLKALADVPFPPKNILEIGCGKGVATTVLAQNTEAHITTVDNEESALSRLMERVKEIGVTERITPVCASMTDMPLEAGSYDLIWCEGSAYIMGVTEALKQWHPLLENDGVLVFSDMVWQTENPSDEAREFWTSGYPDIGSVERRLSQIAEAGYQVISTFPLSHEGALAYYQPFQQRLDELRNESGDSQAFRDARQELDIFQKYSDEFSYQMFIVKK